MPPTNEDEYQNWEISVREVKAKFSTFNSGQWLPLQLAKTNGQ